MSETTSTPASRESRRPSSLIFLAAALVAAVTVAGCGIAASPSESPSPPTSAEPSASPSGPTASLSPAELEAIYAKIEKQVLALRGLEARKDVAPTILDEEGLTNYAKRTFAEDNPPEYIAAYERFYRAMGQLDPAVDLEESFIDLLASQVLGLYDPDSKDLFVVARSGDVGAAQRATYAHEFDHALQDQHFDSDALTLAGAIDQGDRLLARLSLLEGDAYVLMAQWVQEFLTPAELQEFLEESSDPEAMAILEQTPGVIRDGLEFPATAGLLFVLDAYQNGGWDAVDALYERPPDSTEQVLHPEKYTADEKPVTVTLPTDLAKAMGDGWSEAFEDTYGEFGLRQWLREVITDADATDAAADVAANGWGGDRVVFLEGPSDAYAGAVVTEWDAVDDADEFATQATLAAAKLPGETSVLRPSATRVVVLLASDAAALAGIGGGLGVAG